MTLMMIAVWGLIAWVVIRLATGQGADRAASPPPASSAREILDARLARGEIDPSEYRERLELLEERAAR